jgi:hypothetical protein
MRLHYFGTILLALIVISLNICLPLAFTQPATNNKHELDISKLMNDNNAKEADIQSRIEAKKEESKQKAENKNNQGKNANKQEVPLKTVKIYQQEKYILDRLSKSPTWMSYLAIRTNNFSYCDSSSQTEQCFSSLKDLSEMKSNATGACDDFGSSDQEAKDGCLAINKGSCGSLAGANAVMCQALLKRDVNMLLQAMRNMPGWKYSSGLETKARFTMGVYNGFKSNDENVCNNFLSADRPLMRWSCNMLFGNQSAQQMLGALSKDIATAWKAKESKKNDLCSRISNAAVKDACLNTECKSLNDIIKKVWE